MFYMCNSCYHVLKYSTKHKKCKKCGSLLFEIDEIMIPIIKILNEKGYKTEYCCSSHTYGSSNSQNMYIKFSDNMQKIKLCNLPFMFNWDTKTSENILRMKNKYWNKSEPERTINVYKGAIQLIQWATNLSKREKEE